jgi:hypothetical protein
MGQYVLDFLNIFTGLRKTIVMLLTMGISTFLVMRGNLSGDNFTDLTKTIVIGFFSANSIEHFSSMVQAHLSSKNAAAITGALGNSTVAKAVENVIVGVGDGN